MNFTNDFSIYKNAWISNHAPHCTAKITPKECNELLKNGGWLLRNTYDFDTKEETSFWFVIKDKFDGMEELSSKVRNQVRRSLKTYDIRRITLEELRKIGYAIFVSAQESYNVKCAVFTLYEYENLIKSYSLDKYKEFWAVYYKGTNEAVAVGINTVKENCCEYNTLKATPESLHNNTYPYYGLIYEMNRYYLRECGLKYVNDGARTLTEHSNIQDFLESKFKFRKAYCKLQVVYKWWFGFIVKLLYPFRNMIPFLSVKSILRLEEYRRNSI